MKILFTGASSFTGYWFVKALTAAGHSVVATYQGEPGSYTDARAERIQRLSDKCTQVFGCSFGTPGFMDLVRSESGWDMLCHHAADVRDYRSPEFDVHRALAANTRELPAVLQALTERDCRRLLLTGSVFEPGEGIGSEDLPAFSPYGVSKALTATTAAYYAAVAGMHMGKFVIPNPFGPFEEPRFTAYLVNTWARGETAAVNTPDYVRDNIHVSLLAAAYVHFAEHLPEGAGSSKLNPSGYVESQGQFAMRFAANMRARCDRECALTLTRQAEFDEPRIRINSDAATAIVGDWSEQQAWDDVAAFYAPVFAAANGSS